MTGEPPEAKLGKAKLGRIVYHAARTNAAEEGGHEGRAARRTIEPRRRTFGGAQAVGRLMVDEPDRLPRLDALDHPRVAHAAISLHARPSRSRRSVARGRVRGYGDVQPGTGLEQLPVG